MLTVDDVVSVGQLLASVCAMRTKNHHPTGLLYNVECWRSRAERARAVAEKIADAHSRETMVRIANYYERMAQLAERLKKAAPQKCHNL